MRTPQQTVTEFLHLLELADDKAFELLADDIEWSNTGLPTFRGKRVAAMLDDMVKRDVRFEVTMHNIASDGEVVLTERSDLIGYGRVASKFRVDGTFVVRDGKIVTWSDRYNPAALLASTIRTTLKGG